MPSYKTYTTQQYEAFLSIKFNDNFGFSEEKAADWFMKQPGARAVINSYGVTKDSLLKTYIPRLKQKLGGYMFFLMYTVTESGGAGNWINHFASDTSSGGLNTLTDDCDYLLSVNNKYPNLPVAMTAPEVNGSPPPADVAAANAFYKRVGKDTIGAVFMPSTMAGNAWVWGEKWCLANQGPRQPAVYFGNPYDLMIKTIHDAGVDPFKGTGGNPVPKGDGGSQSSDGSSSATAGKDSGPGFYYVQNNTFWRIGGGKGANISRSGDSGSPGGGSNSGGNTSGANPNVGNFSDPDDQKLWKETENENPAGGNGLTPHTRHVRAFIMKKFGIREAHGVRADDDGTGHGHSSGMAVDFMVGWGNNADKALGQKMADYFQKNFKALGIYYIIWQQRFYMDVLNIYGPPNSWNMMPDRGSPTQNHMDHVHVSFAK